MAKKIDDLTPKQEAQFDAFVDKWTRIGRCTDPADRSRAKAAIRKIYEAAGLASPERVVWCGSPLGLGLTRTILTDENLWTGIGNSVWGKVRAWGGISTWISIRNSVGVGVGSGIKVNIGNSVRDRIDARVTAGVEAWVETCVRASVKNDIRSGLKDSIWNNIWNSVAEDVKNQVWDGVWNSILDSVGNDAWNRLQIDIGGNIQEKVRNSVEGKVWDGVRTSVWDSIYGQHVADEAAVFDFFREVCGLITETEKFQGIAQLAESAGWALPCEKICFVSERHDFLSLDDQDRPHSLIGPAITYPDTWAVYAVHGVRVPEYVVLRPHEITLEKIEAQENTEIRRVMIDRYKIGEKVSGITAYVRDSGIDIIDCDERYGTLYRKRDQNGGSILILEVVNAAPEPDGSFKHYFLHPHPECRPTYTDGSLGAPQTLTALNALASISGMTGQEYLRTRQRA